jgi:hypothetical protein
MDVYNEPSNIEVTSKIILQQAYVSIQVVLLRMPLRGQAWCEYGSIYRDRGGFGISCWVVVRGMDE